MFVYGDDKHINVKKVKKLRQQITKNKTKFSIQLSSLIWEDLRGKYASFINFYFKNQIHNFSINKSNRLKFNTI